MGSKARRGPRATVTVDVLGALRLAVGGSEVDVPGPKRRAILVLLARAQGRVVSTTDLVNAVWPSEPPEAARAALHSHVSRLRSHLGPAAGGLETAGGGYRLMLAAGALDAARAQQLLERARDEAPRDPAAACALLAEARDLWRGPPIADLQDVAPLAAWTTGLAELRGEIEDLYLSCLLDGGQPDGVVGLATEAVNRDPLREPGVLLLMRSLAATGRTADALRAAYHYRRTLAREAGLDPTPALGALEREIAAGADDSPRCAGAGLVAGGALVGRDSEVATLGRLLERDRLVTVVGTGGVGKTRLAVEVARRADDATVLPLAPVTDPSAIPHALAAALDLRVARGDVLPTCIALLASGPRLLLLDNCEHLAPGVGQTVAALIGECPELTILATSREPLRLPSERVFRLAPLPLPARGALETLERAPAVALFVDRARQVRADFGPRPAELPVIGEVVRRLDGIPLAIELAAGRMSSLDVAALHARLDRALDLLGDHAPPRRGTARYAPRSSGPTSCCRPTSGCCSATCRSSPTVLIWRPRSGSRATSAWWATPPGCSPGWWTRR